MDLKQSKPACCRTLLTEHVWGVSEPIRHGHRQCDQIPNEGTIDGTFLKYIFSRFQYNLTQPERKTLSFSHPEHQLSGQNDWAPFSRNALLIWSKFSDLSRTTDMRSDKPFTSKTSDLTIMDVNMLYFSNWSGNEGSIGLSDCDWNIFRKVLITLGTPIKKWQLCCETNIFRAGFEDFVDAKTSPLDFINIETHSRYVLIFSSHRSMTLLLHYPESRYWNLFGSNSCNCSLICRRNSTWICRTCRADHLFLEIVCKPIF